MSGYIGPLPVPQGIQRKQSFTATASQTTFNTNGYTDGNFINVYLNGVRLINGTDYTATNGSDIVLTTGASASDVLDFETFDTFELVNQTFDNVTLKNPTHEDTDGGRESAVSFKGEQSGGEISTLAQIQASHDGTSDDQKGDLIFKTNDGSDNDAPTEAMRIDSAQNVTIGDGTVSAQADADNLVVGSSTGNNGITIASATNGNGSVRFADTGGTGRGLVYYDHDADNMRLFTAGSERMRIDDGGNVGIGVTDTADAELVIRSTGVDGTYAPVISFQYSSNSNEHNSIGSTVSSNGANSGINFKISDGGGVTTQTEVARITRNGITFFGDNAAANALDDYEEGTWTPALTGPTSVAYSDQTGRYTKIGRMVWLSFHLTFSTAPTGSSNYRFIIPFTPEGSSSRMYGGDLFMTSGINAADRGIFLGVYNGSTSVYVYSVTGSAQNTSGSFQLGTISGHIFINT